MQIKTKHINKKCANCGQERHPDSTLCINCFLACGGGKHINNKEEDMIKTAPRISEKTAVFLPEHFRTLNQGLEYIIDSFMPLFQRTMHELRGKFTAGELKLMIDAFNSTMLTPGIAGQHLPLNCSDAMDLDGYDEKWKVDKKTFLDKLQSLTIFQAACLEIWANGFWYGGPVEKDLTLDEHIKLLI